MTTQLLEHVREVMSALEWQREHGSNLYRRLQRIRNYLKRRSERSTADEAFSVIWPVVDVGGES